MRYLAGWGGPPILPVIAHVLGRSVVAMFERYVRVHLRGAELLQGVGDGFVEGHGAARVPGIIECPGLHSSAKPLDALLSPGGDCFRCRDAKLPTELVRRGIERGRLALLATGGLQPRHPHQGDPNDLLLGLLHGIEESPWGDWYGRAIDARFLATRLKRFDVKSTKVKYLGVSLKGYRWESLAPVWDRYLLPIGEPGEPGEPVGNRELPDPYGSP